MHPPEISADSWFYTVVVGAGLFFGGVATVVFRMWNGFKEPEHSPPQGFILERAELANLGDIPKQIRDLAPQLQAISPQLQAILDVDRSNGSKIDEALRSLRVIENDITVRRDVQAGVDRERERERREREDRDRR